VSVFFNTTMIHGREIVVDHQENVPDVDATSRNAGSDEHRAVTTAEGAHRGLPLLLVTITMNRRARELVLVQQVVEFLDRPLGVGKDDHPLRLDIVHVVEKGLFLFGASDLNHILNDVSMGASSTANTKTDVSVREMSLRQVACGLGKGGREEHVVDSALLLICWA
jgi:hypothetical protein